MPGTRSVLVDLDRPARLEPDRLEAEVARRRAAADADEQLVAGELLARLELDGDARRCARPSTAGDPTRTSTPRSTSASCTSFAANSSSRPSSRGTASTIVTFEPSVRHAWPSSTPTTPPPSTISRSGTSFEVVASRFVQACASASPGIGGTAASLPVATTTARRASSCRPSTSTRRSPVEPRACRARP